MLFLLPVYINMQENREKGGVEGKGEEGREEEMEKERKSNDPHTWPMKLDKADPHTHHLISRAPLQ